MKVIRKLRLKPISLKLEQIFVVVVVVVVVVYMLIWGNGVVGGDGAVFFL